MNSGSFVCLSPLKITSLAAVSLLIIFVFRVLSSSTLFCISARFSFICCSFICFSSFCFFFCFFLFCFDFEAWASTYSFSSCLRTGVSSSILLLIMAS